MINFKDPEFLRYLSLSLTGLIIAVWGVVGFLIAGKLKAQLPVLIASASEKAPEAIPAIQSAASSAGTFSIVSIVTVLVGVVVLASGVISIRSMNKPPASWAYYEAQNATQARQ